MIAARRGTRQGESVQQWAAFTGTITAYGAVSIIVFEGRFRQFPWLALCVTGVLGGIALIWWQSRASEYRAGNRERAIESEPLAAA